MDATTMGSAVGASRNSGLVRSRSSQVVQLAKDARHLPRGCLEYWCSKLVD